MFMRKATVVAQGMSGLAVRRWMSAKPLASKFSWPYAHLPIEEASTPPKSWYFDPEFFNKVEKQHTFKTWLNVGRSAEVAEEGQYMAISVNDEPIIVARHQGQLLAYYNVCRHHAAQILDDGARGCLQANERFTCPYHGWQYNIEGRLAKANQMKGCKDFHAKEFGLRKLSVREVGPWIYVDFSNGTQTFEQALEGIDEVVAMLDKTEYRSLKHVATRDYAISCNWKVFVDNYLDGGYHVPYAHKALSSNLNLQSYKRYPLGAHYMQTCDAQEGVQGRLTGSQALYIFQFPNLAINRYGKWMDTNAVYPLGPDRCVVRIDWFVDPSDGQDVEASLRASEVVQQEDVYLCQRVQRGLASDGYEVGRYAPALEGGEYVFHQRLHQDLLRASSAPSS